MQKGEIAFNPSAYRRAIDEGRRYVVRPVVCSARGNIFYSVISVPMPYLVKITSSKARDTWPSNEMDRSTVL